MHYFKDRDGMIISIEDRLWTSVLRNEKKIEETDSAGIPIRLSPPKIEDQKPEVKPEVKPIKSEKLTEVKKTPVEPIKVNIEHLVKEPEKEFNTLEKVKEEKIKPVKRNANKRINRKR